MANRSLRKISVAFGLIAIIIAGVWAVATRTVDSENRAMRESMNRSSKLIEDLAADLERVQQALDREKEVSAQKHDPRKVNEFVKFLVDRVVDSINEANSKELKIRAHVTETPEHVLTTFSPEVVFPTEKYDFLLEEKVYFPSGEYSLKMAYERSKLIEAIFSFVGMIQKYYPRKEVDVKSLFQGGADSRSDDVGIVSYYKGEFGTIIANNVIINGKQTSVFLQSGEGITNAHIAFLRAYGAFDAFRSILRDVGVPVSEIVTQLVADEYEALGKQYRFGQVTISVRKDAKPLADVQDSHLQMPRF